MEIQQIRNATLKIKYGNEIFLLDPWLQDKGKGFSAKTIIPEINGLKNPLNKLPQKPKEILKDVKFLLVTHNHPDHFTPDYLPKKIKILVANELDKKEIEELGFTNVIVIGNSNNEIIDIKIKKIPGVHGDNKEIALKMGNSNGYFITGEKKSLYIAGDTILNNEINSFLKENQPNVIILNCNAATMPSGRLIMNLDEVKEICLSNPNSKIILTHFDSVNHGLISSKEARKFIKENNLKNAIILKNGESIKL